MKLLFQKCARQVLFSAVGCVALFSSAKLNAFYGNDCCYIDPCCPCGDFYVGVDVLYWKTMHDPIFVALASDRPRAGRPAARFETNLTGQWDPGVRVHFGYVTPEWFADLSYLYFSNKESVSRDLNGNDDLILVGTLTGGQSGTDTDLWVRGHAKYLYQNVDGRLGYSFFQNCRTALFYYGNVRFVKIDFSNLSQAQPRIGGVAQDFTDYYSQHSKFRGGGFGAGIGGHFNLLGKLGLGTNVGIMAIMGETTLQNSSAASLLNGGGGGTATLPRFLGSPESFWHILPAIDFKIGLDYSFCICERYTLTAEFGYELNHYSKALRYAAERIPIVFGSERILSFQTQDIGFGGPFVNLTFLF